MGSLVTVHYPGYQSGLYLLVSKTTREDRSLPVSRRSQPAVRVEPPFTPSDVASIS